MKQALPPDHPVYDAVQEIGAGLSAVFDEVTFQPLHNKHAKVLSVFGVMPGDYLAGYHDVWLTMWRGFRDGRGRDGSPEGLWIQIDEQTGSPGEGIQMLNPDRPGFSLTLPDMGSGDDELRKGIEGLHRLFTVAEDALRGLVGLARDEGYARLNGSLYEGMSSARGGAGLTGDGFDDGDAVSRLQDLCLESALDFVEFGAFSGQSFVSSAVLGVEGAPVRMSVWLSPAGDGGPVAWLELDGRAQQLPRWGKDDAPIQWPGEDEDANRLLAEACSQLLEIHEAALVVFQEVEEGSTETAFALLNATVEGVLSEGLDDDEPHRKTWHAWVDEFSRQCKLGLLAGITLEESPYGGLNIAARILDPITRNGIHLKVYWDKPEDTSEPEHWLAADQATSLAHDGDQMYPKLLAGFPEGSREHIRHTLDHLHAMVHLATDVVDAKATELLDLLKNLGMDGDVPDLVAHEMQSDAIADALAGLNGIARLYTGSIPERDVRNS